MLVVGISLGRLDWLFVGAEEAWRLTPLKTASHLDSKISVGKSPSLDTHQWWFID